MCCSKMVNCYPNLRLCISYDLSLERWAKCELSTPSLCFLILYLLKPGWDGRSGSREWFHQRILNLELINYFLFHWKFTFNLSSSLFDHLMILPHLQVWGNVGQSTAGVKHRVYRKDFLLLKFLASTIKYFLFSFQVCFRLCNIFIQNLTGEMKKRIFWVELLVFIIIWLNKGTRGRPHRDAHHGCLFQHEIMLASIPPSELEILSLPLISSISTRHTGPLQWPFLQRILQNS